MRFQGFDGTRGAGSRLWRRNAAWIASGLRRLAAGETMELRGFGRSLWPLVRSGDRLLVEAVEPSTLMPGHLVVGWLPGRETLVCHVLMSIEPLRTAPILGEDDGEVEVLARVVRVQGRPILLDRLSRTPVFVRTLRKLGMGLHRGGWTKRGRQHLEACLGAPASAHIRRSVLGPCPIRQLTFDDFEALAVFTGHHLPALSVGWLEEQLGGPWQRGTGGGFATFDRRNHIRAFGFLGRYTDEDVDVPGIWLRSLYTAPIARGLGLGNRLIAARLALATDQGFHEVHSDIHRDNARSLGLHLKHGFVEVPPWELEPFEPLLERARRRGRELVILRWRPKDQGNLRVAGCSPSGRATSASS